MSLVIRLVEAFNLHRPSSSGNTLSSYCECYLYNTDIMKVKSKTSRLRNLFGKSHKTKVHTTATQGGTNPVWNEDVMVSVPEVETLLVVIKVISTKQHFLGQIVIPLSDVASAPNQTQQCWYDVMKDHNGKLSRLSGRGQINVKCQLKMANMIKSPVPISRKLETVDEDTGPTLEEMKEDPQTDEVNKMSSYLAVPLMDRSLKLGSQAQDINVFIGTWNVGNEHPPDDLSTWLPIGKQYDIVAVGAQECGYTCHNDMAGKPLWPSCESSWIAILSQSLGSDYRRIAFVNLWEMRLALFVHVSQESKVKNVQVATKATGIANVAGNKGACVISVMFNHSSLCFVNCHLAAHQDKNDRRGQDISNIISSVKLEVGEDSIANDFTVDHDYCFWFGDLNYRLSIDEQGDDRSPDEKTFDNIVEKISQKQYAALYDMDQLKQEQAKGLLCGFNQGKYNFAPTFKVLRHHLLKFDKKRSPAWCDRILWKEIDGELKLRDFRASQSVMTSDHKPVSGVFTIRCGSLPSGNSISHPPCFLYFKTAGKLMSLADIKAKHLSVSVVDVENLRSTTPTPTDQEEQTTGKIDAHNQTHFMFLRIASSCFHPPIMVKWEDRAQLPPVKLNYNNPARLKRVKILFEVVRQTSTAKYDTLASGVVPLSVAFQNVAELSEVTECAEPYSVSLVHNGWLIDRLTGQVQLKWHEGSSGWRAKRANQQKKTNAMGGNVQDEKTESQEHLTNKVKELSSADFLKGSTTANDVQVWQVLKLNKVSSNKKEVLEYDPKSNVLCVFRKPDKKETSPLKKKESYMSTHFEDLLVTITSDRLLGVTLSLSDKTKVKLSFYPTTKDRLRSNEKIWRFQFATSLHRDRFYRLVVEQMLSRGGTLQNVTYKRGSHTDKTPSTNSYIPRPVEASFYARQQLEEFARKVPIARIAKEVHLHWKAQKQAENWTYGPLINMPSKQHPVMLDWKDLAIEQITDFTDLAMLVILSLFALGYEVMRVKSSADASDTGSSEAGKELIRTLDDAQDAIFAVNENLHEAWADGMHQMGWKYGAVLSPTARTNPLLVPYKDTGISAEDDAKTVISVRATVECLFDLGCALRRRPVEELGELAQETDLLLLNESDESGDNESDDGDTSPNELVISNQLLQLEKRPNVPRRPSRSSVIFVQSDIAHAAQNPARASLVKKKVPPPPPRRPAPKRPAPKRPAVKPEVESKKEMKGHKKNNRSHVQAMFEKLQAKMPENEKVVLVKKRRRQSIRNTMRRMSTMNGSRNPFRS